MPPKLDVAELNAVLTNQTESEKEVQGALLLFTYLIQRRNVKGHDADTEAQGLHPPLTRYTQIPRHQLRSWLGSGYFQRMATLVRHDYVQVKTVSVTGKIMPGGAYFSTPNNTGQCKQFRIHPRLLDKSRLYKYFLPEASKLLDNKIAATNAQNDYREYYREYIKEQMRDVVMVDTPESRAAVQKLYDKRSVPYCPSTFIELFNENPFRTLKVCAFGRRLHGDVVVVPKSLRLFLRFKSDPDSPLVVLDYVNSQPYFLSVANAELIREFVPECSAAIPYFEAVERRTDVQFFKKKCAEGQIYEYLRDEFNARYQFDLDELITRDDAKEMCYVAFFSNYSFAETAPPIQVTLDAIAKAEARLPTAEAAFIKARLRYETTKLFELDELERCAEHSRYCKAKHKHRRAVMRPGRLRKTVFKKRAYQLVKELFPNLHQLFSDVKSLSWDFNKSKPHANNSLLAQRLESALVFTRIVKALVEEGVTKLFTIHDALVIRQQDEATARAIMAQEMKKLNLFPQFK